MYLPSLQELKGTLISAQLNDEIKGFLLFAGAKNQPTTAALSAVLETNSKPLLGGIFPEIIAEGMRREEGFLLIILYQNIEVRAVNHRDGKDQLAQKMQDSFTELPQHTQSAFCFVNALWSQKKRIYAFTI